MPTEQKVGPVARLPLDTPTIMVAVLQRVGALERQVRALQAQGTTHARDESPSEGHGAICSCRGCGHPHLRGPGPLERRAAAVPEPQPASSPLHSPKT